MRDIYQPIQRATTGMLARPQAWWPFSLGRDPESARDGYGPRFCAVLAERGYVVYRIKRGREDDVPHKLLRVIELVAADVETYRALWQFVFDVDLVGVIEAELRPADELLGMLLAEPLRLRLRGGEPFYLCLTQLDVSLGARSYADQDTWSCRCATRCATGTPAAGGCGRPGTARHARSGDTPDLSLDTRDLAGAYLGAVSFRRLALAGLVTEHSPERSAVPTRCLLPTRCRGPRSTSDARVCHHGGRHRTHMLGCGPSN
ncbi:MAG: hypothetical protein M3387_01370 [Actinomycetota bacterium]|nr:hypothetical protein [Actinomycetota bacterium]